MCELGTDGKFEEEGSGRELVRIIANSFALELSISFTGARVSPTAIHTMFRSCFPIDD